MKFRDRLLSLNDLIEREMGRPISVREYVYCNCELNQKNLNHVQMDFSRLYKMGLLRRRKGEFEGRRAYVYTLSSKGRKYVTWLKKNSEKEDDFLDKMIRFYKVKLEWESMRYVRHLQRTGRTDELKNWRLETLEDGRSIWMPVREAEEAPLVQTAEACTVRLLDNGSVLMMTDREYHRLNIARDFLMRTGIINGYLRDEIALFFSQDSWLKT